MRHAIYVIFFRVAASLANWVYQIVLLKCFVFFSFCVIQNNMPDASYMVNLLNTDTDKILMKGFENLSTS